MAKNPKYDKDVVNDAICAKLNGGTIRLYDGAQPAGPATAVTTQNILSEHGPLGTPAFGASAASVATANAIPDDTDANATGNAAWYRCFTSGGVAVHDGSVGVGAGSYDCVMLTVAIQQHATVKVASFTMTAP